jgi:cystathionine beta-lyase/cystathionine gamma-synthase
MKFNTKVYTVANIQTKHRGCNVYQTTTYAQTSRHPMGKYEYSRTANPTRTALENALAVSRMAQEDWPFHLG